MLTISSETEADACRQLWEQCIPPEQLTDLWDIRACFHEHFQRELFFVVARDGEQVVGLIPLCFIPEHGYYGYFPGEVWMGKTWLERNRIIARDAHVLKGMFQWLQDRQIPYHIRYLLANGHVSPELVHEDEIGYLFYPRNFENSVEEYYRMFSRKSIKTIRREVDRFYSRKLVIRTDFEPDFEVMIALNIERFGTQSYFADNQFATSFRVLRDYLRKNGMLKITTVLIDDKIAAVDMGCLYNGDYILLAGGTHTDYPGIAKLINLHHIQQACSNNYEAVDFLCGDFTWKKIFHLSPRILYKMSNIDALS